MAYNKDTSAPLIKRRKIDFNVDDFEFINQTAKNSGLTAEYLLMVCSWIESDKIDDRHKYKLIECLIPSPSCGTIPYEICIRLTYLLKASQTSIEIKVEILKWMICAHPLMEISGRFQMVYEVLFMLCLKNNEMRPYIARFLCLITQRKNVTFNRVNRLSSFVRQYDNVPFLMLLLRVFYLQAPEHFEEELHEDLPFQLEPLGSYPTLIKNVHRSYSPNFSKIMLTTLGNNSTTVSSEFDTATEKVSETPSFKLTQFFALYKQFRALERSTDISKILTSGLKYIFFTSREYQCNSNMKTKIQDYIISMLHNSYNSPDIIERHSDLFRLQRSFPGMSEFIEFLLLKKGWSPDTAEVMCFEPICCFKKIQYKLQVIREMFLTTEDVGIKCQWLNSLSKMFCYWILQSKKSVPCDGKCNDDDSDTESDTPLFHIPLTEISHLGSQVDLICDSLIMENSSPFVLSQILQHYQMGAIARQLMGNVGGCLFPSPSVFHLSLFSLTPFLLESLSGFMLRINASYDSRTSVLENEESATFLSALNDVKKIFLGGSYERESTYLAKTRTFKKLNEICSDFQSAFILYKHPALLLTAVEFGYVIDLKDFLNDLENRRQFCLHLAKNGYKDFATLISKIK